MRSTLKPSLVEWKPTPEHETTFWLFGSLKPSLVEWKLRTFLPSFAAASPLETFLGGMETRGPTRKRHRQKTALKPSLVEWKQAFCAAALGYGEP